MSTGAWQPSGLLRKTLGVSLPDLVVHGGDLVLNGPRPAEVIDLISPDDLWRAPPPDSKDTHLRTTFESLEHRIVIYAHRWLNLAAASSGASAHLHRGLRLHSWRAKR
jgi:hypothetical protein